MEAPTENPVELITGLGATGVEIMLAHIGQAPLQAHPMIALLQVSGDAQVKQRYDHDLDLSLDEAIPSAAVVQALFDQIGRVASREYTPKLYGQGNTNFQLTRGLLGLSL
jgi:hypothetical protein